MICSKPSIDFIPFVLIYSSFLIKATPPHRHVFGRRILAGRPVLVDVGSRARARSDYFHSQPARCEMGVSVRSHPSIWSPSLDPRGEAPREIWGGSARRAIVRWERRAGRLLDFAGIGGEQLS